MKLTQAQMDALHEVYIRWQDKTPHAIMPTEFEIVPDDEYRDGDYIGLWVGPPHESDSTTLDGGKVRNPGFMYLGIESDGHTHS